MSTLVIYSIPLSNNIFIIYQALVWWLIAPARCTLRTVIWTAMTVRARNLSSPQVPTTIVGVIAAPVSARSHWSSLIVLVLADSLQFTLPLQFTLLSNERCLCFPG